MGESGHWQANVYSPICVRSKSPKEGGTLGRASSACTHARLSPRSDTVKGDGRQLGRLGSGDVGDSVLRTHADI